MDLRSLTRTFWRFKFASVGVILATIGVGIVFVVISPPVYTATSSYLLVEPPDPPTEAEVEANPRLTGIRYDNPFMRYTDTSVILNVIAQQVSREPVRQAAQSAGGNNEYEVSPSRRFGGPSPIVDITATGRSQKEVLKTLDFVGKEISQQLRTVQVAEDVDGDYMFTVRLVEYPESAKRVVAGTLRAVIGIGVIGALVLVVLLALLQARSTPAPAPSKAVQPRRSPPVTTSSAPRSLPRRPAKPQPSMQRPSSSANAVGSSTSRRPAPPSRKPSG